MIAEHGVKPGKWLFEVIERENTVADLAAARAYWNPQTIMPTSVQPDPFDPNLGWFDAGPPVFELADPEYDHTAWECDRHWGFREYVPGEDLQYEVMVDGMDQEDWDMIDNEIAFRQTADKIGSSRILKACLEGDKNVLSDVIRNSNDPEWLMLISQFIEDELFDTWACDFIQARIDNIKLAQERAAERRKPKPVVVRQGFTPVPVRKGTHLVMCMSQKFLDARIQEGYKVERKV